MTTLVAWISYTTTGANPNAPGAIYVVSDSRITWGSQAHRWDAGRKVFVPTKEPHIFGYCGDVVFPSLVLAQITSAVDQRILFPDDASPEAKHEIVLESIKESFGRRHNAPDQDFTILHALRKSIWPDPAFALWTMTYDAKRGSWDSAEVPIVNKTSVLLSLGSGTSAAKVYARRWQQSDIGGTSRSIFSAFCDAICSGDDPLTGGPLQIAALYNALPPQTIGFIRKGKHYLHGLEIRPGEALSNIEWRDELFQRIDPITMKRIEGARRFVRPADV